MTAKDTTKLMHPPAIETRVAVLEAKVTERDATITALKEQLVQRTTELETERWQRRHNLDGRTLAGIVSRQTERIELLEAAVLGLADETPDPADAELEGLVD